MSRRTNTSRLTSEATTVKGDANLAHTETNTTETTEAPANTKKIEESDLKACGDNKSAKIRQLNSEGFTRSQIAKFLNIKYQFVRNVLVTKLAGE